MKKFSSRNTTIWLVQNVVHDLGGGKYNSVPCIWDCMLDLTEAQPPHESVVISCVCNAYAHP